MNRYFCDLHIHSCLSPCGDDDMTPGNIAGMAALNGLQIVALTDHNSSKNCPAFMRQAKAQGLIPVPGMELTTAEDIHVVCLFRSLEDAMAFDGYVSEHRMKIPNRPDIFGHQYIVDENEEIAGEEEDLLISAADLSLEDAYRMVLERGGVCFPAHIDREANGIIATLGVFPETPPFGCVELHDMEKLPQLEAENPALKGKFAITSSDAHYLHMMRDKEAYFELDDEPFSGDKVRSSLFALLRTAGK